MQFDEARSPEAQCILPQSLSKQDYALLRYLDCIGLCVDLKDERESK